MTRCRPRGSLPRGVMTGFKKTLRVVGWSLPAVVAIAGIALYLAEIGFLPWSPINCRHEEVDILSGRIRHTRYLLFYRIENRVEDSPVTKALLHEDLPPRAPEWHRVNTFSPNGRISPHYSYHGAIAQIRELQLCWDSGKFTREARRKSARRLLLLWQQSGGDDAAKPYLRALSEISFREERDAVTELDLPPE